MSEITNAIKQICEEKGLSYKSVIFTIESALSAAYRKDFGQKNQNIQVEFNPETATSKIFDIKTVVENIPEEEKEEEYKKDESKKKEEEKDDSEEKRRFNPKTEIEIKDAKLIKKTAKIGDIIKTKLKEPEAYGRMAAQTAKQVIIQKLREAEREMIFDDFKNKEHEVISGVVQRREGNVVLIDLGKTVGILHYEEMIPSEKYNTGDRIKIYVKEVILGSRGPEIILSRTSDEILKKVFYLEIPEISNGLIELKAVAREAGHRSKVAVWTDSDNVDPIGSCVGQKGTRIQTIITELGGEKIDIIPYDENPEIFITNALSPAKIINVSLNEEEKKATVKVANDQLSLAIGKNGQNARLAAKLTGWKIDIIELEEKNKKDNKEIEKNKDKDKKENKDKNKDKDKKDKSKKE